MKLKHHLVLLIVCGMLLSACKKSGSGGGETPTTKLKYLTQIIAVQGTTTTFTNYSYDTQKRLTSVKYSDHTVNYAYNGNDLTSIERIYTTGSHDISELTYLDGHVQTMKVTGYNNGQTGAAISFGFLYSGDQLTEKHQDIYITNYSYDSNNNVSKISYHGSTDYATMFEYDNKKSKFINLPATFKKTALQTNQIDFDSSNNVITSTDGTQGGINVYTYNYDDDGYPTGAVMTNETLPYLKTKYTYIYTEL